MVYHKCQWKAWRKVEADREIRSGQECRSPWRTRRATVSFLVWTIRYEHTRTKKEDTRRLYAKTTSLIFCGNANYSRKKKKDSNAFTHDNPRCWRKRKWTGYLTLHCQRVIRDRFYRSVLLIYEENVTNYIRQIMLNINIDNKYVG